MSTSASTSGAVTPHVSRRDAWLLRLMSLGFGIGSFLFGLGAVLAMIGTPVPTADEIFVVGAICFTFAAAVQLLSAIQHAPTGPRLLRHVLTDPDLVSSTIQLIGTLYFNVMTVRALLLPMTEYGAVWRPDVYGSVCFLLSSWIAWHPVVRLRRYGLVITRSSVILWANMLGSIFFAVSAWGATLIRPGTFENSLWANLGTLLGAIGFLIAAVLVWPTPSEEG